jgi:cytochrome c-type biogenesis protein
VLARVDSIKKILGILIGLTGLAILSGGDKWLEARVLNLLPESWVRITTLF